MKNLVPAVSACALLASACVDNDQSMFITRFVPITFMSNCYADPGSQFEVNVGVLDTNIIATANGYKQSMSGYIAAPVVQNNLLDRTTTGGVGAIQRDNIQVTGVDVELHFEKDFHPPAGMKTSFSVSSNGGIIGPMGGKTAVAAEVISSDLAIALDQFLGATSKTTTVVVRVRPTGTHDSGTLSGGWAELPVKVCHGCLASDLTKPCTAMTYAAAQAQKGSCSPAQDSPTVCCQYSDSTGAPGLACGASVPNIM